MTSTGVLWGSGTPVTAVVGAGSWAGAANAAGSNNSTFATWTSTASASTGRIRVENFGGQAAIGAEPLSIENVVVTVYGYVTNATRVPTIDVQLANDGSLLPYQRTMTASTNSSYSQSFTFTDIVTWAYLYNLGIRVSFTRGAVTTAGNGLVDAISINVNYTPQPAVADMFCGLRI